MIMMTLSMMMFDYPYPPPHYEHDHQNHHDHDHKNNHDHDHHDNLKHLSRRGGGAGFKVFCNFEPGARCQETRCHLLKIFDFFNSTNL